MKKPIGYRVKVGYLKSGRSVNFLLGSWKTKEAARNNLRQWIEKNPKKNFGQIIEVL